MLRCRPGHCLELARRMWALQLELPVTCRAGRATRAGVQQQGLTYTHWLRKKALLGPAGDAVVKVLGLHLADCSPSPRPSGWKPTPGTCARVLKTLKGEWRRDHGVVTFPAWGDFSPFLSGKHTSPVAKINN